MQFFLIPLLSVLALLVACSVDKNKEDVSTKLRLRYTLAADKHIRIEVDSTTNTQKYIQLVAINDTEYLIAYQPKNQGTEFHIFDFKDGKLVSKISFLKSGPNGVGNINSVATFCDFNRILLSQVNSNTFFLCDSSGKILQRIDLSAKEDANMYPMPSFPAIIFNNKLYCFALHYSDVDSNVCPEIIYDLETKTITNNKVRYPHYSKYFINSMEVWKSARCIGHDSSFIYSFAFDNNIYQLRNGNVLKHHIPNSDFDALLEPVNIDLTNMSDQMKFISEKGLYTYLFYDKYRNIYYRIFIMPGEHMDSEEKIIMNTERSFKIQLVNTSFELIGEAILEGGKYNPYRIMISKDGLVLGVGSHLNPVSDEYYSLQIFKIKQL